MTKIAVLGHAGAPVTNTFFALANEPKTPVIIIGPGGTIKHNDTDIPNEEILKQIKDLEVIKVPDIIKVIPEDILMPNVYFQDPVERKSDNQPWAKCNRWGKRRR